MVKNLPAIQETEEMRLQSLGQGDPMEEEMAAHSRILAWRTPWTEEPGGLQSVGWQRVRCDRIILSRRPEVLGVRASVHWATQSGL